MKEKEEKFCNDSTFALGTANGEVKNRDQASLMVVESDRK